VGAGTTGAASARQRLGRSRLASWPASPLIDPSQPSGMRWRVPISVGRLDPVAASVIGYACGGVVSYTLNRRHTFASDRPHAQAVWRFALVAGLGLVLTGLLMALLSRGLGLPQPPIRMPSATAAKASA
jgi:hypothetical protein